MEIHIILGVCGFCFVFSCLASNSECEVDLKRWQLSEGLDPKAIEVANCTGLLASLATDSSDTILINGAFSCTIPDRESNIELRRDVQIIGCTSASALDWKESASKLFLSEGKKLLFGNLILAASSLEDMLAPRFMSLGQQSSLLFSGVVFAVRTCATGTKGMLTEVENALRPDLFPNEQRAKQINSEIVQLSSLGVKGELPNHGFVFVCASHVVCHRTLADLDDLSSEIRGFGSDCSSVDKGSAHKSSRDWIRETELHYLAGVGASAGIALGFIGFCLALLIRHGKALLPDRLKKTIEGASAKRQEPSKPLHAIETELLSRIRRVEFDVEIGTLVGRGGYGRVYKGTWKGTEVAIKVIEHGGQLRGDTEQPLEAFLCQAISHPNIVCTEFDPVQTFAVHTSASEEKPPTPDGTADDSYVEDIFSQMANDPSEQSSKESSYQKTMIVLEYCNRGSLQEAIKQNLFLSSEGIVSMKSVLLSALDIANALTYLHSLGIMHGDLKAGNVLLRTMASDQRGFICKVSDFGLARMMANGKQLKTFTYGTVSHMPPELLKEGIMLPATDVYSFGILLWEMLARAPPYPNKNHGEIILGVAQGMRPKFTDDFPPAYAKLIKSCWCQDHLERLCLVEIVQQLRRMFVNCKETKASLVKAKNIMLATNPDSPGRASIETPWESTFSDIST